MTAFQGVILALIEGITEFLPVSSTGHMIIGASAMGIAGEEFTKTYIVCIQLGAILSVLALYWKKFFQSLDFYFKLLVAFMPAAVFGILFNDAIDSLLENASVVGITLLVGGIIFLFIDKWFKNQDQEIDLRYTSALKIGFFQTLAMVPGVSRSAATIIGGLAQGLSRKTAAEFSFFLAVPTMAGATAKKLYDFFKVGNTFSSDQIQILCLGNLIAFLVAMIAIRSFIQLLTRHGFRIFGWYRIGLGLLILILQFGGFGIRVF